VPLSIRLHSQDPQGLLTLSLMPSAPWPFIQNKPAAEGTQAHVFVCLIDLCSCQMKKQEHREVNLLS
jgi:hypothetical protein